MPTLNQPQGLSDVPLRLIRTVSYSGSPSVAGRPAGQEDRKHLLSVFLPIRDHRVFVSGSSVAVRCINVEGFLKPSQLQVCIRSRSLDSILMTLRVLYAVMASDTQCQGFFSELESKQHKRWRRYKNLVLWVL